MTATESRFACRKPISVIPIARCVYPSGLPPAGTRDPLMARRRRVGTACIRQRIGYA